MVMIVCLHYLGKGAVLEKATLSDPNYYVAWLFELLSIVAVNCFIMCSGYLMTENRFRFSKLIYLWLQIVSINILFLILSFFVGDTKPSVIKVIKAFFPINTDAYWFMTAYFAFYLLSPLLIRIANKLTVSQLKKLVIVLVIVFSLSPWQWTKINYGYHFVWFVVLFFVAAYIRRADLFNKKPKVYIGYYLVLTLVLLTVKILVSLVSKKVEQFKVIDVQNYNFIITFLSSLMFFVAFKNIKISNTKIGGFATFMSSLVLGVYLFHENEVIRYSLWYNVIQPLNVFGKPYFVLHMIACVFAVFFICAFLEYFRQLLFKLFNIPSLCDKLGAKVQKIADKVFESDIIKKL